MLTDIQEMFDAAVRGLAKQGYKSAEIKDDGYDFCKYRHYDTKYPNGVGKCGVGQLIPDERYHEEIEENSIASIIRGEADLSGEADLKGRFPEWSSSVEFLSGLQNAHDLIPGDNNGKFEPVWGNVRIASNLLSLADTFKLNPAVLYEVWPKEEGNVSS